MTETKNLKLKTYETTTDGQELVARYIDNTSDNFQKIDEFCKTDTTLSVEGGIADAKTVGDNVSQLKEDLGKHLQTKYGKNLFPFNRVINDISIKANDGTELNDSGWYATDFIEIEPNTRYAFVYLQPDNTSYPASKNGAYYTENEVYISGFSGRTTDIQTPSNAKYIRISSNTNIEEKLVFCKNTDITDFSFDSYEKEYVQSVNDVVNVYGTGLILPYSVSGSKFKVEVAETFVIYYVLRDGTRNVKSIAKGSIYLIPSYTSLVLDTTNNLIKQVPNNRVNNTHIVLLQTGAYVNDYTRYFKGYFADRVTVTSTYEEYDKNNVRKEYERTVDDKMVEVIKDNPSDFSFLIGTDMHIVTSSVEGSRPVLNVLNRIQDRVHCDAIFNLGDTVMMGKASTKEAYYSLQEVVGKTADKEKAYFIVGNHDYNHRSDVSDIGQEKSWVLPYMDVYRILGKQHENDVVWGSKERMYYYKDFVEQKIRVIFLNTLDRPEVWETVDGVQKEKYTWLMNVISATQTDWLVDVALNFTDKADKTEWAVIICSHVTPSATAEWNDAPLYNAEVLRQISEAFITGGVVTTSFTDTTFDGWSSYSRRIDFTSQGAMKLIGWFSGHSHIDTHSKVNGVNYVNTVCGYTYNVNDSQSMKDYTMTDGTYTEFGLDVCSLDKSARKLTLHRFGVGADREITY